MASARAAMDGLEGFVESAGHLGNFASHGEWPIGHVLVAALIEKAFASYELGSRGSYTLNHKGIISELWLDAAVNCYCQLRHLASHGDWPIRGAKDRVEIHVVCECHSRRGDTMSQQGICCWGSSHVCRLSA